MLMTGTYSGAENVAITIINNSKKRCDSAYFSKKGDIAKVLKRNNITYYYFNNILDAKNNMEKAIKDFQPDIIHAHDYLASFIASCNNNNVPMISHLHNDPPFIKRKLLFSRMYLSAAKKAKFILSVSEEIKNKFIYSKMVENKFKIVYNPIDTKSIEKLAIKGKNLKNFNLIFVGRLIKIKDPLRFCKIIRELKKIKPDVTAAILGSGPLENKIHKYIKKNNLTNTIFYLGYKHNPYKYINNSQILCMTSKREGFPIVACEALSLGLPVISTPVGGLNKIINSETGFLCKTDNEFISNLNKLLHNIKKHKFTKQKCKDIIKNNYSSNIYTDNLIQIYKETILC